MLDTEKSFKLPLDLVEELDFYTHYYHLDSNQVAVEALNDFVSKQRRLFQSSLIGKSYLEQSKSSQFEERLEGIETILRSLSEQFHLLNQSQPINIPPSVDRVAIPESQFTPSPYLQIDNFLSPKEHQELLDYVLDRANRFQSTSTTDDVKDYRRSMVLYSFPKFANLITQKLQQLLAKDTLFNHLDLVKFQSDTIECQLTSHNDGNFYKIHNDNGSPETATRELTYVYYFNREPKGFSGGNLKIYDEKIENNFYVAAESFHIVEPRNNSIVFFLSRYHHEVLPVSCPSRDFADSRFTINGWIRR
jgi:SM-20-related protein